MSALSDLPVALSPAALAGELAAVSAALATPLPPTARMPAIADAIHALLDAVAAAPPMPSPDDNDDWLISRRASQITVACEHWLITAHCVAGIPDDVQLMAGGSLLSFDFSPDPSASGDAAHMRASERSGDGSRSSHTYFSDGRIMDDDDWTSGADEEIRANADDSGSYDDTMAGHFDDGTIRRTATVAGVAGAAAALGGMIKRMSTKPAPLTPEPSPTAQTAPGHSATTLWHYVVAGQAQAPEAEHVLRERLARKELPEETLVWNPQLPDWRTALAAGLVVRPVILPPPAPAPVPPPAPPSAPVQAKPKPVQTWHYAVDGKTLGPVDEALLRDELRGGRLSADTLVWNASLPTWVKASAAGLLSIPVSIPVAPISQSVPTAPPAARSPAAQVAPAPIFHSVSQPTPPAATRPVPPAQLHCTRCQQTIAAGAKFCTSCGQAVTSTVSVPVSAPAQKTCPRCATVLTPADRFCTGCGAPQA